MHAQLPLIAMILSLLSPLALAQATQPAAPEETLQLRKQKERLAFEARHADTRTIGPFTIRQVVRLGVSDSRLAVATDLPPTNGDVRLNVTDDPSGWRGVVHRDPARGEQPLLFMVEKYDFSDPQTVQTHAQVLASPAQVQVAGDWEYPNGILHVSLLDAHGSVDPDEGIVTPGSVTLFVNGYDNEGGRHVNVRLRAPDLRTLRREHPREVSAYLRPVLRELDADDLVAIDPRLAWQVLGTEKAPDPEVSRKVQAILPRLDADRFLERERAVRELRALGVDGALVLLQLDRGKLSPEQNARVEEVIGAYHQAAVTDVSRLADDLDFLLDVLLTDEPELRQIAVERITRKIGRPLDFDINAPLRERADRVATLRDQLLPPPTTQAVDPL